MCKVKSEKCYLPKQESLWYICFIFSRQITKANCVEKGYNRRSPRGWLEHEETKGEREDLRPGSPAHI